ncbi:unnamed protein product [Blepharisma stoltei]|uniref:Uncharacterized protein n=1 Tax=Blepharisma stoltei TaxID=1481888 RepID=A0AAU9JFE2_9CILI|nr:unnamed protein product [Blepharisma stoltei]
MDSRKDIQFKFQNLKIQLVKEWIKQAYFRKDNNINLSYILENLTSVHNTLLDHSYVQDEYLSEAILLTEGIGEVTPRFLESGIHLDDEEDLDLEEPLRSCIQTLKTIQHLLSKSYDSEESIVTYYKTYAEKMRSQEIVYRRSEVENEMLREEREELQKELEEKNDKSLEIQIKKLTKELEQSEKENKILKNQQLKLQEDSQKIKAMHEELKKSNEELISEYRQARSQQEQLLKSPNRNDELKTRIISLENQNEQLHIELTEIEALSRKLQEENAELAQKLEQEQRNAHGLSNSMLDLEDDAKEKDTALEKAQILVKKLNDECEKLVKELSKASSEIENLKKDNRSLERSSTDVKKKMQDIDIMRRTEERLREENTALKNKLIDLNDSKNEEINKLNAIIEEISREKTNIEGAMEELEEKLTEIEKLSQERTDLFYQSCNKVQELEEVIKQKSEENKKIVEDFQNSQGNREKEVIHWKRQAENVIRQLHSLQEGEAPHHQRTKSQNNRFPLANAQNNRPPKKKAPVKLLKGNSPNKENIRIDEDDDFKENFQSASTLEGISQQLEEALLREAKLKKTIKEIAEREGKKLAESLEILKEQTAAYRSEAERWIMRNEELEQQLLEMISKNANLLAVIRDLKKMMQVKNQQTEDQNQAYNSLKNEMQGTIDFLISELNQRDSCIKSDLIPYSEKVISHELSHAHEKINELKDELREEKSQNSIIIYELEREKKCNFDNMNEIESLRRDLVRNKNDLWHIQKLLGTIDNPNEEPYDKDLPQFLKSFSSKNIELTIAEQRDLESITETARKSLERIKDLHYCEIKLLEIREELNTFKEQSDYEKQKLLENIDSLEKKLREKESLWEDEKIELNDTAQNLKNIIAKEQNEKFRIKGHLEEQLVQYKREIAEINTYSRAGVQEKILLEDEYVRVRKELDNCNEIIQKQENNIKYLEELQIKNAKEIEALKQKNISIYDELKSTKSKNFDYRVVNLQEIIETQETTISQLQSQIKNLNIDKLQLEKTLTAFRNQTPEKETDKSINELKEQLSYLSRENIDLKSEINRITYKPDTTKTMINRREADSRFEDSIGSRDAYSDHLEKALCEKNEIIANLENQITVLNKSSKDAGLALELEKIKQKKDANQKNFDKRLKEFELILRYLEEKIMQIIINAPQTASLEKMGHYLNEITQKNITLDLWLKGVVYKLESYAQNSLLQKMREINTYTDICKICLEISLSADATELREILSELNSKSPDLEKNSQKLVLVLRNLPSSKKSFARQPDASNDLMISRSQVDSLAKSSLRLQELESSLAKKAENLNQISDKTVDLLQNLDSSHYRGPKLERALNILQKCCKSYSNEINSDSQDLRVICKLLSDFMANSPENELSLTLGSYTKQPNVPRISWNESPIFARQLDELKE